MGRSFGTSSHLLAEVCKLYLRRREGSAKMVKGDCHTDRTCWLREEGGVCVGLNKKTVRERWAFAFNLSTTFLFAQKAACPISLLEGNKIPVSREKKGLIWTKDF